MKIFNINQLRTCLFMVIMFTGFQSYSQWQANGNTIRQNNLGNKVAIGVSTADAKFHVLDKSYSSSGFLNNTSLQITNESIDDEVTEEIIVTHNWRIQNKYPGKLDFAHFSDQNNPKSRFTITSDGIIGVGTTNPNPNSRFHVYPNSNGVSQIHLGREFGANEASGLILGPDQENNSDPVIQGIRKAGEKWGSLSLQPEGGSVIIGPRNEGEPITPTGFQKEQPQLAVNGRIFCKELNVFDVSHWGDFVFKKDYNLMKIKDLEEFVVKYNHLPNIPSAKIIEENGIDISEMQNLQIQKIEELTLYIIELHKRIENMEKKINE